jgi:S1-C subfamily serine protease
MSMYESPLPESGSSRRTTPNAGSSLERWLPALVVILSLLLVLQSWLPRWQNVPPVAESRPIAPRGNLGDDEQATIELFRQSSKSVVYITTTEITRDFFFNDTEAPKGTGSGLVWDEQGHIVTNFHVIRGASAVRVTLADQSTWNAKYVGGSLERDLAVLRLELSEGENRLTPILVGQSHDLEVGQKVFAIGNPFGLDQTLTTGIVSGLGRKLSSEQGVLEDLIQTDAAINPGNSGGPLLDSAGRLIGVNTAIYSPSGASAGVGFAIPVDDVQRIVPELIKHGRVIHPGLGARYAPDRLVQRLGLKGVLVADKQPDSAAAKAGLQGFSFDKAGNVILGDLIVGIEGREVTNVRELFAALRRYDVNQEVKLTVLRNPRSANTQKLEIPVVLQAAE